MTALAEIIFELVLQVFLEFICYAMGHLAVSVFSLGRWTCDGPGARLNPLRPRIPPTQSTQPGRRRRLSVEATQLVGFLALVVLGVIALIIFV